MVCCAMIVSAQSFSQTAKRPLPKKSTVVKTVKIKTKSKTTVQATVAKEMVSIGPKVKITTDSGVIVVKLYDSTPLHRDNFLKLVKEGFYDSLMFHRVIAGFMIQGGDPGSKHATADMMLGNGGGDMPRIPAEFRTSLFHKKGVLAAARDGNPEKASSACQFYLVQGKVYKEEELAMMEMQMGRKFSPAERVAYKTIGGTPFLDKNYTVYGEVISGMEVIDKIASVPTGPGNRPVGDVRMKMEIIK